MYGWDTLVLLQHLLEDGLSKSAIAQRLSVSRRMVHYWIATGQLTRDLTTSPPRRASPRTTHRHHPRRRAGGASTTARSGI